MPIPVGVLKVASKPTVNFTSSDPRGLPLTLHPGEEGIIINIVPFSPGEGQVNLVSMGVTQHPNSIYTYLFDGISIAVAAPLGTFYNPLYTCRDWGQFIVVRESFIIVIRNNDTEPHMYAAQVVYQDHKKV
jgi:hypothetical protein